MSGDRRSRVKVRYVDANGTPGVISADETNAVAFEDCRPIRTIPSYVGQRHTPGQYWSATTGTLLDYESFLECQWLTLLDFDPTVTALTTQALEIASSDPDGRWRHVPDMFVRRTDGSVLIVDVKHPRRRHKPTVVTQQIRTAQACQQLGWNYRMVDAVPAQRYANVAWLAGYRRPLHATASLAPTIRATAQQPVTIGDLATAVTEPALARPVIFHLLWHHVLDCDLDAPLHERTLVRAVERSHR